GRLPRARGRAGARAEEPGRPVRVLLAGDGPAAAALRAGPDDLRPGPLPWPRGGAGCGRPPRGQSVADGLLRRELLAGVAAVLADADQGRRRAGLCRGAGAARRRGGHEPDAVRGDGRLAARVRGAERPGCAALADGGPGAGAVVLGRGGRNWA